MTDPVVTVQPDAITVVVNNDQDAVTVSVGSDSMAPMVLTAASATTAASSAAVTAASTAQAAAAAAEQALADITAIVQSALSSEAVIYTDRYTGTLYRLVLVNGELLKEEVDPNTVIITGTGGSRGLWGVLTGL